jgi:hypothetical protein
MSNLEKLINFCRKMDNTWEIKVDPTWSCEDREQKGLPPKYITAVSIKSENRDHICYARGNDHYETVESIAGRMLEHFREAAKVI